MSLKLKLLTMADNTPPPSSNTKFAKLVLNKLGQTLEEFHSRAMPILSLSEQLHTLQSSPAMAMADASISESEVKDGGGDCDKCRELRGLELREERLNEFSRKLGLREKRVEEEFRACCDKLRLKKAELVERRRAQGKEMESKLEELSKRWKDLEAKEKVIKAGFKRMKSRERRITEVSKDNNNGGCGNVIKGLDEQCRTMESELGLKEEEIAVCWKLLEMREAKINESFNHEDNDDNGGGGGCRAIQWRKKETMGSFQARELAKRVIDENMERMKSEEKGMEDILVSLELKVKKLEEYCEEIETRHCQGMESREKQLIEVLDVIDAKAKQVKARCQEVEVEGKKLSGLKRDLEAREGKLNERCQEVGVERKKLSCLRRDLETREEKLKERCQEVGVERKKLGSLKRELEMREEKLNERCLAQASKEKELDQRLQTLRENRVHESDEQIFRLCKAMSGRALQMLVNERFTKHQSMMENLCNALKLSNDPAKLVLSAVYGFYPPHLERQGSCSGFDTRAVRTSCMLLLEYLMNMKAFVSEAVKNEAVQVANQWREGILTEGRSSQVVLGFLLLLAAYDLGANYVASELQGFYGTIHQHRLASQIGLRLGLSKPKTDKQSDSRDGKKRDATTIELSGEDKRHKVDPSSAHAPQQLMPYNPTGAFYSPAANSVPFEFQYPVWPHRATPYPATCNCNCMPPFWCSWCRPLPYSFPHFSQ